jgi:hypothetical protein
MELHRLSQQGGGAWHKSSIVISERMILMRTLTERGGKMRRQMRKRRARGGRRTLAPSAHRHLNGVACWSSVSGKAVTRVALAGRGWAVQEEEEEEEMVAVEASSVTVSEECAVLGGGRWRVDGTKRRCSKRRKTSGKNSGSVLGSSRGMSSCG